MIDLRVNDRVLKNLPQSSELARGSGFLTARGPLTIHGVAVAELTGGTDFSGGSSEVVSIDRASATIVPNPGARDLFPPRLRVARRNATYRSEGQPRQLS